MYIYFFIYNCLFISKKSYLQINKLIGNGEYGLFYTSRDSQIINFSASNIILNELYQLNNLENTIIYIEDKNTVKLSR